MVSGHLRFLTGSLHVADFRVVGQPIKPTAFEDIAYSGSGDLNAMIALRIHQNG